MSKVDPVLLQFSLNLNPDAFTANETVGDAEQLKKDQDMVREMGEFMNGTLIPGLVSDIYLYGTVPLNGESLTDAMHRRGINMRYLSKMIAVAEELDAKTGKTRSVLIRSMCVQEMLVRVCKHLLRTHLQSVPSVLAPSCIAHFFNSLLNVDSEKPSLPSFSLFKVRTLINEYVNILRKRLGLWQ